MDNLISIKRPYWLLNFEDDHLCELSSLSFSTQLETWKHVAEIHRVLTPTHPPTNCRRREGR
jgi:hypothetical protein